MKTFLKTVLLASAICLPLSSCGHYEHDKMGWHKDSTYHHHKCHKWINKSCPMSDHMNQMKEEVGEMMESMENMHDDIKNMINDTTNAEMKKQMQAAEQSITKAQEQMKQIKMSIEKMKDMKMDKMKK
ncbi:hypothetical protein N9W34_00040 [Rickettsiales bacterium]|nr:hypothetical protein [Rickettsiales bacterium]